MTGKSIRGFYEAFRRNGHLVFPVREVKGDIHRGAVRRQHVREKTKKTGRPADSTRTFFFVLFTFSFRVACFSILAAGSSGLCDGRSLSSHRTPATLLIRRLRVETRSKSVPRGARRAASVDRAPGNSARTAAVSRNFSQGKCAMLSNLFLFFLLLTFFLSLSPCCHSGSLTAPRREPVGV